MTPQPLIAWIVGGNWDEAKFRSRRPIIESAKINTLVKFFGANWFNLVSPREGAFDFSGLHRSLETCKKHGLFAVPELRWDLPPKWYARKHSPSFEVTADGRPLERLSCWWLIRQVEEGTEAWHDLKLYIASFFKALREHENVIGAFPWWRGFNPLGRRAGRSFLFSGFEAEAREAYDLPFPQPRTFEDFLKLDKEQRKAFIEWYVSPFVKLGEVFVELVAECGDRRWQIWHGFHFYPPEAYFPLTTLRGITFWSAKRFNERLEKFKWATFVIDNDASTWPGGWVHGREWVRRREGRRPRFLWTWEVLDCALGDTRRHLELLEKFRPHILTYINFPSKRCQWARMSEQFLRMRGE